MKFKRTYVLVAGIFMLLSLSPSIFAHCDALDGPVIIDAKKALSTGSAAPVLKWVKAQHANEIKSLFTKTIEVSKLGIPAKEIAEQHFFETLVRLHRAGEGAPFTGIKPAGQTAPIVLLTDKALQEKNIEDLIKKLNEHSAEAIRVKYKKVMDAKMESEVSPEKGRKFVQAYVEYTHFVEELHDAIMKGQAHGAHESNGGVQEHNH